MLKKFSKKIPFLKFFKKKKTAKTGHAAGPNLFIVNSVLLSVLLLSTGGNQIILYKIHNKLGIKSALTQIIEKTVSGSSQSGAASLSGNAGEDAVKLAFRQGVPEIYGSELGVSFDQVVQSMSIMKIYDPTYGQKKITLTGDNLKRYIEIGSKIACEYCCGAKSLVFPDGKAACGCAHSQAMRGLAAYLILNHGGEYSNDQILRELARWKGKFFPKKMSDKVAQQLIDGNFTPDTAALVLGLKLPDYGKGNQAAPLPSNIKDQPGMVGGC